MTSIESKASMSIESKASKRIEGKALMNTESGAEMNNERGYMPVSREEMLKLGIEQFDFVYILGDAYVDHPSFGAAIISRVLEHNGFTI